MKQNYKLIMPQIEADIFKDVSTFEKYNNKKTFFVSTFLDWYIYFS